MPVAITSEPTVCMKIFANTFYLMNAVCNAGKETWQRKHAVCTYTRNEWIIEISGILQIPSCKRTCNPFMVTKLCWYHHWLHLIIYTCSLLCCGFLDILDKSFFVRNLKIVEVFTTSSLNYSMIPTVVLNG